MKTEEGNILIGKFMGLEIKGLSGQGQVITVFKRKIIDKKKFKEYKNTVDYIKPTIDVVEKFSKEVWTNIEDSLDGLKYDYSWNELMTVVEKIEKLTKFGSSIEYVNKGFGFKHYVEIRINGDIIIKSNNKSKIQSVYESVVEFIEWYNKNK